MLLNFIINFSLSDNGVYRKKSNNFKLFQDFMGSADMTSFIQVGDYISCGTF